MELVAAEKNYLDEDLKMHSTVRDRDLRHHAGVLQPHTLTHLTNRMWSSSRYSPWWLAQLRDIIHLDLFPSAARARWRKLGNTTMPTQQPGQRGSWQYPGPARLCNVWQPRPNQTPLDTLPGCGYRKRRQWRCWCIYNIQAAEMHFCFPTST